MMILVSDQNSSRPSLSFEKKTKNTDCRNFVVQTRYASVVADSCTASCVSMLCKCCSYHFLQKMGFHDDKLIVDDQDKIESGVDATLAHKYMQGISFIETKPQFATLKYLRL
jgi:hypothetical protein